ncbi:MAG TPA: hypothetical protein VJH75_00130 [Patescibacteria group bacterium]|nr:hypothetical protein [Patescibacteria group bacterium]
MRALEKFDGSRPWYVALGLLVGSLIWMAAFGPDPTYLFITGASGSYLLGYVDAWTRRNAKAYPPALDYALGEVLTVDTAVFLAGALNIEYVGELIRMDKGTLQKTKMSCETWDEVNGALRKFGLSIGMSFPSWTRPDQRK